MRKSLPVEARRLTLYRNGRRVGSFTVRLKPGARPHFSVHYPEHLAFSADGRYLSWVIDAGVGKQMYVFATGL